VNDAGDTYTVRIDQIRKVKVKSSGSGSSSSSKSGSASKKQQKSADASADDRVAMHRFVSRIIADLVSVSSGPDQSSDGDQTGR
jgi:hypothetical protein